MPDIYTYKYGIRSPYKLNDLEVELRAYRNDLTVEKGGLGPAVHFRKIAEMLWGPKSEDPFIWNPWAEEMNDVVHINPFTNEVRPNVGFSGCASSGKSHYGGLFAIINWLCDPSNTYVFCTSTSLTEAKHRIWKSVCKLFGAVPGLPGKLVDSMGKICTVKADGKHDDSAGIFLIAAAPNKEREAVGKLIGKKNKRVIFIADELAELSHAILEACFGNLISNPLFQLIGMSNFKSRYDPFGEFTEPEEGWEKITVDSKMWKTKKGLCIRFDGVKSPNIVAGKDLYPRIYGSKQLTTHRRDFGENSAMFWRMCRSFEAPIGLDSCIYSEADIVSGGGYSSTIWRVPPTLVSGLDPSFTNGGDRAMQVVGQYGISADGLWTLQLTERIPLYDDATQSTPRDYQIARRFRDNCISRGILPENSALDVTGAGSPFYSIVTEEWDPKVLPINFSGSPSDMFVRNTDSVSAKKQFDRRVSELWWVGKEFMRFGQIKGITPDLARELKARLYETVKSSDGLKVCVEPKKDMKERLGFSPDLADAWCVMLDLCRQRFGALAGGESTGQRGSNESWQQEVQAANEVYANANYGEPEYESEGQYA